MLSWPSPDNWTNIKAKTPKRINPLKVHFRGLAKVGMSCFYHSSAGLDSQENTGKQPGRRHVPRVRWIGSLYSLIQVSAWSQAASWAVKSSVFTFEMTAWKRISFTVKLIRSHSQATNENKQKEMTQDLTKVHVCSRMSLLRSCCGGGPVALQRIPLFWKCSSKYKKQ